MDFYKFPEIRHISQVLEAIQGREEFYVAERDRHTVVNYLVNSNGTFPRVLKVNQDFIDGDTEWKDCPNFEWDERAAILRECRGIVFGPDGRVIARRLHKFWNVGEREETFLENIDWSQPHVVLEKLDGSMITPIPIWYKEEGPQFGYHVRWGTKMGLTGVAMQVEEWLASDKDRSEKYNRFAHWMIQSGFTPIFEWCSRKQRIVVDYPRDNLALIAVRHNVTGEYDTVEKLQRYEELLEIPIVHLVEKRVSNPEKFLNWIKEQEKTEGVVIRFDNGHQLKCKADWYVRIHRAKDSILQEKRVVEMIVSEKCDDVKPFLLKEDLEKLEAFENAVTRGFIETLREILSAYEHWYEVNNGDKKLYALGGAIGRPAERSILFSIWGIDPLQADERIAEEMKKRVLKNLGSQTKVDSVRWIWGGAKWADYIQAEDERVETEAG